MQILGAPLPGMLQRPPPNRVELDLEAVRVAATLPIPDHAMMTITMGHVRSLLAVIDGLKLELERRK